VTPKRRTLGKYRLLRKLGTGGSAEVYKALDTVENIHVALKIPFKEYEADFRKEVALAATLDHPHILPVKNADYYDGQLAVAYPLGDETLADRLTRRMSTATCLDFGEQMLDALAYAHSHRIIHCDVKPENLILFDGHHICLADFGIAKIALRTLSASGSGTVGYVAPEQALGKPSFRSDVFSAGLILFRMLSGELPSWPFEWPPPGFARLRAKVAPAMVDFLQRAIRVDYRKRFADAEQMLAVYERLLPLTRRWRAGHRRKEPASPRREPDWSRLRQRAFARNHRGAFRMSGKCVRCGGPLSEEMQACPWCGTVRKRHRGPTSFPARCSRCGRGRKLDWRYCPWCFGPGFRQVSDREYGDVRYQGRCQNPSCTRRLLMPFMRYCPWCRTRVTRGWKPEGATGRCPHCRCGVFPGYWDTCPWCGKPLKRRR
jgi:hypothetical protein